MPLLRQETTFYKFRIFDRWGKIIFESSSPGRGWDGSAKGVHLPPGVFAWDLNMKNRAGNPFFRKGTVMLVR
jgi:gliding motility-associated-like protein